MVIDQAWGRWLVALVVFVAATWLNLHLQTHLEGRAPLLPYFPALVIVGVSCGFGPALALLCASSAAILYFWVAPIYQFLPIDSIADVELVVLFFLGGLLVAGVSASAGSLMKKDRRNRRRLALAMAAGRMVTWDVDLRERDVTTTGDALAIFGQRWTSVEDLLHNMVSEDAVALRQRYETALRQGGRFSHTASIRRQDNGQEMWVQVEGEVATDAKGRAVSVYGSVVDVTHQQQALRASQAAEERFKLALETGKVMAWECDGQARYTWAVNAPAHFARADLVGSEVGSLAGHPELAAAVHQTITSRQMATLTHHSSHDGVDIQLLTSVRPVPGPDGRVERVLGATLDVTELAAAQAQLRVESQRKDTFLATLAHELRNPMAPIRYAVASLLQSSSDEAKQRAAEVISRQSSHMTRLLDDLLDMSRITRNAVDLQRELIDLREVVKQALEAVEPLYIQKQHTISTSMPPDPVLVFGDPTRLQQVLGNLLDNAAKYSPVPGEVTVHLSAASGYGHVAITDRGIGIGKENLPKVFELFTRLDATAAAPSGLGIGLAVTKQLVQLHGGSIDVYSEGAGHGSRFTVRLPLAPGVSADIPTVHPFIESPQAHEPLTVLVVDDNEDGADSLAILLEQSGYQASTAYSGLQACEKFEASKPRIVLLDIGLPDINGMEVARRIRARAGSSVALVAVTGWGQQTDRAATAGAGFDAHLVKPVPLDMLVRTIEGLRAESVAQ